MTTYGIVERVDPQNNYYKYKVRIPIFHGYNSPDKVPTEQLTTAIYSGAPHTEKTVLHKGDLVVVSLLNYDIDNAVILGLMPNAQESGLYGSNKTVSKTSISNLKDVTFDATGSVTLPKDTTITTEQGVITTQNLSALAGITTPIQEQLDFLSKQWKPAIIEENVFNQKRLEGELPEGTLFFIYRENDL